MPKQKLGDVWMAMFAGLVLFWSITFYQFYSSFTQENIASFLELSVTETWFVLLLGFSGGIIILWIFMVARSRR